jgi:hypothetical protein
MISQCQNNQFLKTHENEEDTKKDKILRETHYNKTQNKKRVKTKNTKKNKKITSCSTSTSVGD